MAITRPSFPDQSQFTSPNERSVLILGRITPPHSRRERTAKSRRERTQSRGANELKIAARTNSESRRERTQTQGANELKPVARTNSKSRRERTQSRGANELKPAARTNSKSLRERTQSRGANELKVAARTNSKSSQLPMSPNLPNKVGLMSLHWWGERMVSRNAVEPQPNLPIFTICETRRRSRK